MTLGSRESLHTYAYPDPEDRLALTFDESNEPYPGYWRESENMALGIAGHFLGDTSDKMVMDLGCGTGRMLPRFARLFREVVGVEPDPSRAARAQELVQQERLLNVKVECNTHGAAVSQGAAYDVVVCSHVIQHVSTDVAPDIVTIIASALRPAGVLVLLTSRTSSRDDVFKKSYLTHEGVTSTVTTEQEFNQAVAGREPCLPVRLFAASTLEDLLSGHFTILRTWTYNQLSPPTVLDRFLRRDQIINLPGIRGRFGANVMVAAQRKGNS